MCEHVRKGDRHERVRERARELRAAEATRDRAHAQHADPIEAGNHRDCEQQADAVGEPTGHHGPAAEPGRIREWWAPAHTRARAEPAQPAGERTPGTEGAEPVPEDDARYGDSHPEDDVYEGDVEIGCVVADALITRV